jgi:uncharacterized protein YjbI with pentapeptide repeats
MLFFKITNFQGQVDFNEANFKVKSDFTFANFQVAYFIKANFEGEVIFTGCSFFGRTYFTHPFNNETKFNYVVFEGKEKIIFNIENLSNVSFMNTDVTGVRFSDNARWRGEGGGINVDNIIRKLE